MFRASTTARLLIISQAPGTKVHVTGLSFNDPSGDRLRAWLRMDRDTFYDESRVAIVPMGFCYPGRLPNGGDAPPRPECAPLWRDRLLALMPDIRLTLLVGTYALAHVLGRGAMTEQVRELPRASAAILPAAASVLAHHRLGAAQSLVRRGCPAGIARGCDNCAWRLMTIAGTVDADVANDRHDGARDEWRSGDWRRQLSVRSACKRNKTL